MIFFMKWDVKSQINRMNSMVHKVERANKWCMNGSTIFIHVDKARNKDMIFIHFLYVGLLIMYSHCQIRFKIMLVVFLFLF